MGKLEGRVAIVTGTSRGIGRALLEALREEGASVHACSRTEGCDIRSAKDVDRIFTEVMQREGRLHLLVNNAGILTARKPLVQVSTTEWDDSIAVNLRGVFLCTRAALRIMIPQASGLIVMVSSGAGKRPAPLWGPYGVAKWGVEGLTRAVGAEVADMGIRVVAVNPGGTRTGMRAQAYPDEDPATVKPPEELARFLVDLAAGEIPFTNGDSLDYPGR
jgi:NAD(P)-dependent dehydrogenase (short-subunit alcohol dehydrogenase family)